MVYGEVEEHIARLDKMVYGEVEEHLVGMTGSAYTVSDLTRERMAT